MTYAKHTPGPWRVSEQCAQLIDIRHDHQEPGAISLTLAKVVARPSWQQEAEANAHLIAAAPEMLEALSDLIELADTAMHAANRDGSEYDRDAELAPARAAIAKATGEQA